jgi:hypothetical protein
MVCSLLQSAADVHGSVTPATVAMENDLREAARSCLLRVAALGSLERGSRRPSLRIQIEQDAMAMSAIRAQRKVRRRATYDELVSTGTLGLIRSQTLRNTALQVYNFPTLENIAREGMQSRYREAFRISLPNDVQRALNKNCGDRFVEPGDYKGLDNLIDYPCRTGLPEAVIDEAVATLRANNSLVPLLRLRVADIETRLFDLTGNNRNIMQGLQAIAREKP